MVGLRYLNSFGIGYDFVKQFCNAALYFYKRAVTAFQSLPVCYGGTSGFQCYLFMPTLFLLLATLGIVDCLRSEISNRLPLGRYLIYHKLVFQMLRYTVGYGGRCPSYTGIGQSLARMYHCYGQFRSRFLFIYGDGKPA